MRKQTLKVICRNGLSVLVCLVVPLLLAGCSGVGRSSAEVHRAHMRTFNAGLKQFQDDADSFLMIDQPSRLSPRATR